MNYLSGEKERYLEEKNHFKKTPMFLPAGQSTQLIVGASPENDNQILRLASDLYSKQKLKRVYYSGYVPIKTDSRVPLLNSPPLVRENRIYQADWLLRFYQFSVEEIVDDKNPHLDLEIDPKLGYALRHPEKFPVDINRDDYEMILRVPGIGVKSAQKIVSSRIHQRLNAEHLKNIGVILKRAKYFISCPGLAAANKDHQMQDVKRLILAGDSAQAPQLSLFG